MVLNEEHLKRLLKEFIEGYYHRARPHQGLHGDTPVRSDKPEVGVSGLVSIPVVGGRVGPWRGQSGSSFVRFAFVVKIFRLAHRNCRESGTPWRQVRQKRTA
jgi:hypothetical protein